MLHWCLTEVGTAVSEEKGDRKIIATSEIEGRACCKDLLNAPRVHQIEERSQKE